MTAPDRVDIAVVGGGLVGASAALAQLRAGRTVVLIEPEAPRLAEAAWDERCIGLNAASIAILRDLGVWQRIAAEAQPIRSTVICEAGRAGSVRFTAEEAGLEALGYNTPLRAIHGGLLAALEGTDCALRRATVVRHQAEDRHVRLTLDDGQSLQARLVMACDGTHSALRQACAIPIEAHDYAQTALVTTVDVERGHDDCAWERFTPLGPLAVLPRGEKRCTVVWTQPHGHTEAVAALDNEAFCAALQGAFGRRLGALSNAGRRMRWPLRRVYARDVIAPRLLLAGNAAQTLHPVAAQGFNLGLRDCATAAAVAAGIEDPGSSEALQRYAALRADDRAAVARFTDQLVRLFSNQLPVLSGLRHLGLGGLAITPALYRSVMFQNLGLQALARLQAEAA
ncbi:FAD-dependent monooxygenase [Algiphilus sp.]|uniref:FAD-dependent monooxygenase n=1 Tax=Algiphilus sp. TaxID=1872431 RepID=UPI003B516723